MVVVSVLFHGPFSIYFWAEASIILCKKCRCVYILFQCLVSVNMCINIIVIGKHYLLFYSCIHHVIRLWCERKTTFWTKRLGSTYRKQIWILRFDVTSKSTDKWRVSIINHIRACPPNLRWPASLSCVNLRQPASNFCCQTSFSGSAPASN